MFSELRISYKIPILQSLGDLRPYFFNQKFSLKLGEVWFLLPYSSSACNLLFYGYIVGFSTFPPSSIYSNFSAYFFQPFPLLLVSFLSLHCLSSHTSTPIAFHATVSLFLLSPFPWLPVSLDYTAATTPSLEQPPHPQITCIIIYVVVLRLHVIFGRKKYAHIQYLFF